MATKGEYRKTMLRKVANDEELFILRAHDVCAPQIVIDWMRENILNPECTDDKLREALDCALKMRRHKDRTLAD